MEEKEDLAGCQASTSKQSLEELRRYQESRCRTSESGCKIIAVLSETERDQELSVCLMKPAMETLDLALRVWDDLKRLRDDALVLPDRTAEGDLCKKDDDDEGTLMQDLKFLEGVVQTSAMTVKQEKRQPEQTSARCGEQRSLFSSLKQWFSDLRARRKRKATEKRVKKELKATQQKAEKERRADEERAEKQRKAEERKVKTEQKKADKQRKAEERKVKTEQKKAEQIEEWKELWIEHWEIKKRKKIERDRMVQWEERMAQLASERPEIYGFLLF